MATRRHLGFAIFGLILMTAASGSFSCSSVETAQCVPGKSTACTGPLGCQGFQVCKADGASFDACSCDAPTSSSSSTGSMGTGVGGASTASTGSGTSSSSGAGGAGGAGSFTPADLPGLALWLDDDKGVVVDPQHPGTMLRWLDQSGNANDATAMGLQDGYRFSIDPAVVHGHDAFGCPGNGTRIEVPDAPSLQFGTGEYAVAVVARKSSSPSGPFYSLYEKDSSNGVKLGFATDFELYQGISKVALADPDPSKFHVIIGRGPSLRLAITGANATGPLATGNVDAVGWPVYLCVNGAASGQEIAEVVAVKGSLSDANLAKLQGYFQAKFNL